MRPIGVPTMTEPAIEFKYSMTRPSHRWNVLGAGLVTVFSEQVGTRAQTHAHGSSSKGSGSMYSRRTRCPSTRNQMRSLGITDGPNAIGSVLTTRMSLKPGTRGNAVGLTARAHRTTAQGIVKARVGDLRQARGVFRSLNQHEPLAGHAHAPIRAPKPAPPFAHGRSRSDPRPTGKLLRTESTPCSRPPSRQSRARTR